MSALAMTPPAGRSRSIVVRNWVAVLIPVVLVAVVLAVALGIRLADYDGNVTGFVKFGTQFTSFTHPPRGAVIGVGGDASGYDGQFYYAIARDPLLRDDQTVKSLQSAPQNVPGALVASSNQGYRLLRMGYPAIASLLATATGLSVAAAMLAVNVVVVLLLTGGLAYYARRRGWSSLWSLCVGLLPGLLLATRRDLADPLAVSVALAGLLSWTYGRRRLGVALLILAVLTREVMIAAVAAVALEAVIRSWRERGMPGIVRRVLRESWPAVVLPAAAFAGWDLYVNLRTGGLSGGAGLSVPFANFLHEARSVGGVPPGMALWETAYLFLMIAAIALSVRLLRSEVTVTSAAAALFALTVVVAPFNDAWGTARDSLPMLSLLLVTGLQRRDAALLSVCGAAAAMTAFLPLGIPGPF